jgi:hypothetical protein
MRVNAGGCSALTNRPRRSLGLFEPHYATVFPHTWDTSALGRLANHLTYKITSDTIPAYRRSVPAFGHWRQLVNFNKAGFNDDLRPPHPPQGQPS